jgi:hypothetical protein
MDCFICGAGFSLRSFGFVSRLLPSRGGEGAVGFVLKREEGFSNS